MLRQARLGYTCVPVLMVELVGSHQERKHRYDARTCRIELAVHVKCHKWIVLDSQDRPFCQQGNAVTRSVDQSQDSIAIQSLAARSSVIASICSASSSRASMRSPRATSLPHWGCPSSVLSRSATTVLSSSTLVFSSFG